MSVIDVYGALVAVPDLVTIPLVAVKNAKAEFSVGIGKLDRPKITFELDAAVEIQMTKHTVNVNPLVELGDRAMEHYIVDHAIPNYLSYIGVCVLHSAGVEKNQCGVVLAGDSGAGKSTSCAWLGKHGWRILGDDAVRVQSDSNECTMWPSYPGYRLFPNSLGVAGIDDRLDTSLVAEYANKLRVHDDSRFSTDTALMKYFIHLGSNSEFAVTTLGAAELCSVMARQYMHPPGKTISALDRLADMSAIAGCVSGWRINYPRSHDGLEQLGRFLDSLVDENSLPG